MLEGYVGWIFEWRFGSDYWSENWVFYRVFVVLVWWFEWWIMDDCCMLVWIVGWVNRDLVVGVLKLVIGVVGGVGILLGFWFFELGGVVVIEFGVFLGWWVLSYDGLKLNGVEWVDLCYCCG